MATTADVLVPPPGLEGFPDWAVWIFYGVGAIGAGIMFVRSLRLGAGQASSVDAASRAITAVSSMQPAADRWTSDALVATLATLNANVARLADTLEGQQEDREADEKAELRELRRIVKDIRAKE